MNGDRRDIDEVRARIDIVSLIEPYVTLKRAGRVFKGLCPFHQEKTPSFTVDPALGRWHCFGSCSEGGDIFKFVQKMESLSFPEALERLALRAGVTLARQQAREARTPGAAAPALSEAGERDLLYRINALALGYYRDRLKRAPQAQEYIRGRDLAYSVQEGFLIGFAPDEWEGLATFLAQKGVAMADAERAGLVSQSERGGWFDKLRGRLIFPILDVQERPIAFGGRLIGDAKPGQPKYWNSPETPVFSKSRTLYGLWRARKAIAATGQAVVVEGYTDVLACHQAGFENVVATLGTSLTEEHVRILARLAPVVLLAFDADSAGLKAAGRAAEIFEAQEVDVRVLDLPEGDDPDSLLRAGKRQAFAQALENALPLTEYRIKRLVRRGPAESERDKVALFKKALPILASVPSMVEREQYVRLLAPYHPHYAAGAAYAEEHIRQDVASYGRSGQSGAASGAANWTAARRSQPAVPRPRGATEQAERHLLRALVEGNPELAGRVLAGLCPDEFLTAEGRALAAALYAAYDGSYGTEDAPDARALIAAIADESLRERLTMLLMETEAEPLTQALLDGEMAQLKRRAKEGHLRALKAQMDAGAASEEMMRRYASLYGELKGTR